MERKWLAALTMRVAGACASTVCANRHITASAHRLRSIPVENTFIRASPFPARQRASCSSLRRTIGLRATVFSAEALRVRGLLRGIEVELDLGVVRIEEKDLPGAVIGQATQVVLDAARLQLGDQ